MINYHSELQALVDACESFAVPIRGQRIPWQTALDRARAALSEPEPELPTDDEVEVLADQLGLIRGHANDPCGFWISDGDAGALVRAALARWGRPS